MKIIIKRREDRGPELTTLSSLDMITFIVWFAGLFHLYESICTVSCPTCPCFSTLSRSITLSEDAAIGSSVFTFMASDPLGLTLVYSIRTNPPPPDEFRIDSTTGELIVAQDLDYETTQGYTFTVGVENSNGRDTIEVNVNLANVDDNPTMCAESIIVLSVMEEQLMSDLELPACTDDDIPSTPSFDYSIVIGNETGLFALNGGNVSLLRPLDYEIQTVHDLLISVVQSGGSMNFSMTVIIKVVPVNEHTPQFASPTIDLPVSEAALISSTIGQITATDGDRGDDGTVIYSVLSQSSNKFIVHPNTGEVIVTRLLDYETVQSYSLTVVARDSPTGGDNPRSSTVQMQVLVQDANDNRPSFTSYVYYVRVGEERRVNDEITQLQCNDSDSGLNGEVTYSIVSGNQEGKFQINTASGQVSLADTLDYDNNNTQFYNLTIECQEVQPPRGTAQTSLLVSVESFNEFNPDPGDNYRAIVSEEALPGTSILRASGRDRDSGLAGKLTYSINDGTQYCPERIVYIDQVTGVIYLNAPLDYESGLTLIYCTILVQDSQQPVRSNTADLRITVTNANDVAPVCDPPVFSASIREDSPVGTEVLMLSCNDTDSLTLNYSILDSFAPFQISSSGSLTVNSSLDYEASTFHTVPVEVSDGEFSFNTTVFVNVLGINEHSPIFAQATYVCSIDENSAVGSLVCTVSANDDDSGSDGTVYYQLSTSTPSDSFVVDRESGGVYLAASVDYEHQQSFSLTIEAYDLGEPSLTGSVSVTISVVDLNDNHPHTDSFAFFDVSETAALGERITTLNCTDADAGLNGQVTYQLNSIIKVGTDGSETIVASNPFTLESTTGDLTVNTNLDYETDRLYRLSIGCRDNGTPSMATFSTVAISLQPENEYTPSFGQSVYSVDVNENTTIGSYIGTVSASDSDAGEQGDVFYSIEAFDSLPFAVNQQTGVISLVASPDCLQNLTYTLTVIARDGGSPPLQSQANVEVNVINCHLGSLVPQESIYIESVEENSPSGTAVLTVACNSTRRSLSSFYSPKYRISNSDSNVFQVNEDSGLVSVSIPPDFEAEESHLLILQCFDENHPQITADIHAYILINPVNEHAPEFNEDPYGFSIAEDTPPGAIVFTVMATDSDKGRDGQITYYISGNDSDHFFIDRHSGEVYLIEPLDRESQDELTVTVTAHDNPEDTNSRRTSVSTISIQVTDSNDHWPHCSRVVYHLTVSPQTQPGSPILSDLGCSDIDLGANGELEYTLGDNESGELFAIDESEGILNLTKTLELTSYHVPITVHDRGIPSLSISVLVVVDVREPYYSTDTSISDSDPSTLLKEEGLKNAVTITLHDISFILVSKCTCNYSLYACPYTTVHTTDTHIVVT